MLKVPPLFQHIEARPSFSNSLTPRFKNCWVDFSDIIFENFHVPDVPRVRFGHLFEHYPIFRQMFHAVSASTLAQYISAARWKCVDYTVITFSLKFLACQTKNRTFLHMHANFFKNRFTIRGAMIS